MVTEIHIDLLKKDDIPAVTEIIITTLKKSLIQKLGTEFIKKHFLPAVISHPELTNYVCRYENKIIGFLLFANTQQSMQSLGKEIFLPLIRYAFIKSFVSPSILLDLITSFYNPTSIEENAKSHYYQSVYLVYFCIVKSMQCKGIGAYV